MLFIHHEVPKWYCQPADMRRWFNDVPNQGKIMNNKFQRPNTRAGIYIPRPSDKALLQEFNERFLTQSKKELVETYNGINNIFGVHAQMVYLYVLHQVFLEKFGESPLIVESEVVYCLGPKIYYSEELDAIFSVSKS